MNLKYCDKNYVAVGLGVVILSTDSTLSSRYKASTIRGTFQPRIASFYRFCRAAAEANTKAGELKIKQINEYQV